MRRSGLLAILGMGVFLLCGQPAYSAKGEVSAMLAKLHWLGHDGFRLDASKTIYFDPFKLSAAAKKADLILVTHEHFDHYSPRDISLISTGNTVIVTDRVTAGFIRSSKLVYKEVKALSPQEEVTVSGVRIKAVPSYNIGKSFHTKESAKIGFVVTVDGVTIYHAGDTDFIPEMKGLKTNIALLPVSGTYVMSAEEAAQAALAIKPDVAVPMHYGAGVIGTAADAQKLQELLKGKIETRILTKEN